MIKININQLKKIIENLKKQLEQDEFGNKLLVYYKKFEDKGNAVMDDLEGFVKRLKDQYIVQTPEEYKEFYKDMRFILGIAWFVLLNLEMWVYLRYNGKLTIMELADTFPPFDFDSYPSELKWTSIEDFGKSKGLSEDQIKKIKESFK